VGEVTNQRNPRQWFIDWIRPSVNESGIPTGQNSVLGLAAVYYAVTRIAGHVGQLPLIVYRKQGDKGREPDPRHPAYKLCKYRANPWTNAGDFRECLMLHALLHGNGRAWIERNNRQEPVAMYPLHSDNITTMLVREDSGDVLTDWQKVHVYHAPNGEMLVLPDRDVFHVMGLGDNGVEGLSLLELGSNSFGLGLAAQRASNRLYKNDAVPGLILMAPEGYLTQEDEAKQFLDAWNNYHAGGQRKAGLLRGGVDVKAIAHNNRDSQMIETRLFQRQDAALWFSLEQILGDDSSVSYNSLEEKNKAYLSNCLNRYLVKWEQECREKLCSLMQKDQDSHFFKFTVEALLRASAEERANFYSQMVTMTAMSPNEVREKEDMNPRPGGDEYVNPNTTSDRAAPEPEPAEDDQQQRRTAARRQVAQMLTAERRKLTNAQNATHRGADWFTEWAEKHYGKLQESLTASLTHESGEGDKSAAAASAFVTERFSRLYKGRDLDTVDEETEQILTAVFGE